MNKEKKKGVFEMENINLSIKDILKKKNNRKRKKIKNRTFK